MAVAGIEAGVALVAGIAAGVALVAGAASLEIALSAREAGAIAKSVLTKKLAHTQRDENNFMRPLYTEII
jgi:hypothetical protein